MADASVAIDILAKDRASKEFKKVGDAAENAGRKGERFGKLLGAAAVAGVAALSAVVKVGFDELQDYQKGFAQAQQVIKSTGGAAGVSAKHVEDLASSIQGYSGQTDDAIVAGQNLLLTFTNIKNGVGKGNDVFDQTTKIMADMSQALGQDTKTSAIQLGKALNNPIKGVTALQRVGVTFTASQKATIKRLQETGHTAAAQKVILAELTKEFGGSAKAFGDSGPGQIAKAKRAFEDVSQNVAAALLPILTKLMQVVNDDLIPAFKATTDWMIANKKIVVPLGVALGVLGAAFIVVTTATKAWTVATTVWSAVTKVAAADQWLFNAAMAANPIGLIVIGLAAFAAGMVLAWRHSKTFRDIAKGAFGAVRDAVGWVIDKIKSMVGWVQTAIDKVDGLLTKTLEWLGLRNPTAKTLNSNVLPLLGFTAAAPTGPVRVTPHNTGSLRAMATGGIVTRPTAALVGEAGPEAVIPLGRRGIGGTVIEVHFHTPVDSQAAAREIRKLLNSQVNLGITG